MTRLAPELRPASEAEIESSVSGLLLRYGWYPLKTDAGQVTRGGRTRKRGHIETGFPDMTYLLALPGTGLCLAALIETKTEKGKLRPSQVETHAKLQRQYGLAVHIVRDVAEATALVTEARQLVGALKEAQALREEILRLAARVDELLDERDNHQIHKVPQVKP